LILFNDLSFKKVFKDNADMFIFLDYFEYCIRNGEANMLKFL